MAVPCEGTIKASDINTELGRNPSALFRIGNGEERGLAGVPSGLIKFSDFKCKQNLDDFPWFMYQVTQTGGRGVNRDPRTYNALDGKYGVLWGGTNGWFQWNNKFSQTIKGITINWRYSGRNGGWHSIGIYERFAGAGTKVGASSNSSLQTIQLQANVPPGEEIWINWSGGGDRGDGNNLDYLVITDVQFA